MNYRFWMTFNNSLLRQLKDPAAFIAYHAKQDAFRQIKKSLRVFYHKGFASMEHADNFVQDRTTFVIDGKAYRIPRIVKHSLLKHREAVEKGITF